MPRFTLSSVTFDPDGPRNTFREQHNYIIIFKSRNYNQRLNIPICHALMVIDLKCGERLSELKVRELVSVRIIISFPSGNVAVIISIIMKDKSRQTHTPAIVSSRGRSASHHPNGFIRSVLESRLRARPVLLSKP